MLWALHLPSLNYRRVREWDPNSYAQRAGHSMAGGLSCGGINRRPDGPGFSEVRRLDMLLVGESQQNHPAVWKRMSARDTTLTKQDEHISFQLVGKLSIFRNVGQY